MQQIEHTMVTEGYYWATSRTDDLIIVQIDLYGDHLVVWEPGCDFQQALSHFIFWRRIELPDDLKSVTSEWIAS